MVISCIQLYIPNIQQGIEYYCNSLGLRVIWKIDLTVGLGMSEGITEIDIKVDSVTDAIIEIERAGDQIIYGPFDIKIGKCVEMSYINDRTMELLQSFMPVRQQT